MYINIASEAHQGISTSASVDLIALKSCLAKTALEHLNHHYPS